MLHNGARFAFSSPPGMKLVLAANACDINKVTSTLRRTLKHTGRTKRKRMQRFTLHSLFTKRTSALRSCVVNRKKVVALFFLVDEFQDAHESFGIPSRRRRGAKVLSHEPCAHADRAVHLTGHDLCCFTCDHTETTRV